MAIYDVFGNEVSSGGSSIFGKKIMIISDSNVQYNASAIKEYMQETYGCTWINNATAGAKWETSSGTSATDSSGVGKTNVILRGVSSGSTILTSDVDYYIYMLGTNMGTLGTPSDSSSDVSTMCGAVRYCLEKMCWYGRNKVIGGVLPFRTEDSGTAEPTKNTYLRQIYQEFAVPVLDLWDYGRIINNNLLPDSGGAYAYTDGGNHINVYGLNQFLNILGNWIANTL